MPSIIQILLAAALLFLGAGASSAELAEIIKGCDSCHGADGVSEWSDMPTIAGMSELVHADTLFAYQEEARPCHSSKYRTGDTNREPTDMCAVAKELSEAQIDEIAQHYAGISFVAAKQEFDAALVERGLGLHDKGCEKCHSDGGSNADDDAGILKGQWMDYMRQAMADFKSGDREQPKKMKEKVDALSDEDIEALLHFYASPQ